MDLITLDPMMVIASLGLVLDLPKINTCQSYETDTYDRPATIRKLISFLQINCEMEII